MPRAPAALVLAVGLGTLTGAARPDDTPGVAVDREKKTVTIDAKVAPRKLSDEKFKGVVYPIEVIACWAYPKGQKAHETVVTFEVNPSVIHKALEELGLKPGKPVKGDVKETAKGPEVNIYLDLPQDGGGTRRVSIDKVLLDPKTNKPMPKVKFHFTGSVMSKPAPDKDDLVYGADLTGTLIAIFPVTDETVFQTNLTMKEEKYMKLETNPAVLPKEGTPVKLILKATGK